MSPPGSPSSSPGRSGASGDAEGFSVEEFFRRVAEKEGVDIEAASAHASAVMAVLGETIDEGELQDVREQLPQDFYHLLEQPDCGRYLCG